MAESNRFGPCWKMTPFAKQNFYDRPANNVHSDPGAKYR